MRWPRREEAVSSPDETATHKDPSHGVHDDDTARRGRFEVAAPIYMAAGWPVFPILPPKKPGEKGTPPVGVTGYDGVDLTSDQVEHYRRNGHGHRNIAVRAPVGVVGIDVDHYGDKRGGDTLQR